MANSDTSLNSKESSNRFRKQMTSGVMKLSKETRATIESRIKTERKTITVDGQEYTVNVKICPSLHATGPLGEPYNPRDMQYAHKTDY